ncbi:hypothetical protein [Acinetobacter baumannii]|uniref:hypothetical protein n=1 Tax=Acinetobacter baumannii TaxID=470 RepID=UPI00244B168D|nr:hypothetical protein [Acinetobacter baumannii]MDH2564815.1 hypothetical protein [Acinetobacter baumannii]
MDFDKLSKEETERRRVIIRNHLIDIQIKIESVFDKLLNCLSSGLIIQENIDIEYFNGFKDSLYNHINQWIVLINEFEYIFSDIESFMNRTLNTINNNLSELDELINRRSITKTTLQRIASDIEAYVQDINRFMKSFMIENMFESYKNQTGKLIEELKEKSKDYSDRIEKVEIINSDLKNKKLHEIFEDDSDKFRKIAKRYEISFYLTITFLFLYFLGWYIEINTPYLKLKLAEQFYENHSTIFYIQKISLLILSTTLAAFLLKRSFMSRRLADEAYRTSKELDALPRYMEGMTDEMKEKLRFDLAYKYFGNGIHHESYNGGENLMHENIKANTDFLKSIKDLGSSTDSKSKK